VRTLPIATVTVSFLSPFVASQGGGGRGGGGGSTDGGGGGGESSGRGEASPLAVIVCVLAFAVIVNFIWSRVLQNSENRALEAWSFVGQSEIEGPAAAALVWPSGMWSGYCTPRSRHSLLDFTLRFHAGQVTGKGTDGVGGYRIQGMYDGSRVAFTQQYLHGTPASTGRVDHRQNLGHAVHYRGQVVETNFGTNVRGHWYISGASSGYSGPGDFHLWHAMAGWHRPSSPPLEDLESPPVLLPSAPSSHVTQSNVCAICLERPIDIGAQPCNHVAVCRSCASMLSPPVCPICRTPIARLSRADGGRLRPSCPVSIIGHATDGAGDDGVA
jgi:preprotein translocase subunit SecG